MTWSSNIPGDAHLGGGHPIQVVVDDVEVVLQLGIGEIEHKIGQVVQGGLIGNTLHLHGLHQNLLEVGDLWLQITWDMLDVGESLV